MSTDEGEGDEDANTEEAPISGETNDADDVAVQKKQAQAEGDGSED